MTIPVPDT